MLKTSWKSREEILFSLRKADKVAILSCGTCASLSGTGGTRGLRSLKGLLEEEGKEVVFARTLAACCSDEIMRQTMRIHHERIARADALAIISCAAGVKSAFLNNSPAPVMPVTDPVGSTPVTRRDDPVARSLCTLCGHCVIGYTGGICPVSECPAHRRYSPCPRAPRGGGPCIVDPEITCVWGDIAQRGDMAALRRLAEIHKKNGEDRLPALTRKPTPAPLRRFAGWFMARTGWLHRLSHLVD